MQSAALPMLWISEHMAINPANVVWIFRGAHGELEITFAHGKQLSLHEHELTPEARSALLPDVPRSPMAALTGADGLKIEA